MSDIRQKFDDEFRKNAVKISYASSKPITEICQDLGITPSMLYRWRKKFTAEGDKTRSAVQEEKIRQLQLELAEARIENDMLKKAAAYFAKNQK